VKESIHTKFRIWLEKNGSHILGKGGAEILEAIEKYGSISSASRALGMSYRYVWGYIKKSEEVTGKKIISTRKGGKKGGGASLTPFGKILLKEFKKLSEYMEKTEMMFEDEWGLLGIKISARNRLKAKVKKVEIEGVAGKVEMEISAPATLKALITAEAIKDMDLKENDEVYAIIKATEIMIVKKENIENQ